MVMPEFPFSLFDFKKIKSFEPHYKVLTAGVGVAINDFIYECPKHKFAWILGVFCEITKTTGTLTYIRIQRKTDNLVVYRPNLFNDTITGTTGYATWPSSKSAGEFSMGHYPLFLFPEQQIRLYVTLTAAETIDAVCTVDRIEYDDPRYGEK